MHNMRSSHIVLLSLAGFLMLQALAVTVLFCARQHSRLLRIARILSAFSSRALLALPGVVLVGLIVESMNLLPLQPYLYAFGGTSSYVLLDLCLHLE